MRERIKADLEIRKRIEDLEVLKSVALTISGTLERDKLYSVVTESVTELLDCNAAGFAYFDEDKRIITFPFAYNLPRDIEQLEVKFGNDGFSEVVHTRRSLRIDDYQVIPYKVKAFADAGVHAVAIIPLRVRGRMLALLWAASIKPHRTFSDYDMVLLESLGGQTAVAIDNLDLFDEQRYISETLQRGFLPDRIPPLKNTDIGIFYESATEAAVVGGDFYDFIALGENRMGLAVGDSSGKGVEATADAAMVKYSLRAAVFQNPDPAVAITQSNDTAISQLVGGHFVTLVYSYYDASDGRLLVGIAGNPYPIHYVSSEGQTELVTAEDPALGLIHEYSFTKRELYLQPDDVLVLYTDGLLELRRGKEFYGVDRLSSVIKDHALRAAQEIADRIIDAAREFSEGRFTDDIVLMVVKRKSHNDVSPGK